MSWPEALKDYPGEDVSPRAAEFAERLKQHVLHDGLSPELALDLTLHELVEAAAAATHASAAALALARGDELVCRATIGDYAPDLGIPLYANSGLSGACIRSRMPQHCMDTAADDRVNSAAAQRLGIRSILVVPILEDENPVGIIEVFSSQPSAFSESDEAHLRPLALDCLRLRRLSVEMAQPGPQRDEERPSLDISASTRESSVESPASGPRSGKWSWLLQRWCSSSLDHPPDISSQRRSSVDPWVAVLAMLVTVAAVGLTFLIGVRTGWLRALSGVPVRAEIGKPALRDANSAPRASETPVPAASKSPTPVASQSARASTPAGGDELIVYERGKLVYRAQTSSRNGSASPSGSTEAIPHVWLAAGAAEARLRDRVEPEYPAAARAERRSGNVQLEILVRDDGRVASVRTINGDPLLAEAATVAVRDWRYEPYQVKGHATGFLTEVTLKFALPQ
jgi:L-methionine (R)-S-oxide reductase